MGLLFLIALLATLPPLGKKRVYQYTASEIPVERQARFPLEETFVSLLPAGPKVSLASLAKERRGGLLINFWATWCPPCLEELPSLQRLDQQLKASRNPDFPQLVAISVDDSSREVFALLKTLPFQAAFSILHDPKGVFADRVGSKRYPETYWVAQDGRTLHKWLGPQDWLSESVLRTLASPPTP
ncbi:TlpA family protein disulfide reductase [bacterium]|nr:TlpA family protein disulfide reductase [bacterium]